MKNQACSIGVFLVIVIAVQNANGYLEQRNFEERSKVFCRMCLISFVPVVAFLLQFQSNWFCIFLCQYIIIRSKETMSVVPGMGEWLQWTVQYIANTRYSTRRLFGTLPILYFGGPRCAHNIHGDGGSRLASRLCVRNKYVCLNDFFIGDGDLESKPIN